MTNFVDLDELDKILEQLNSGECPLDSGQVEMFFVEKAPLMSAELRELRKDMAFIRGLADGDDCGHGNEDCGHEDEDCGCIGLAARHVLGWLEEGIDR